MIETFFEYPFLVRALVGVLLLSILTALLGVFVVVRRMAFFGDAIAHSSLAGIALGLLFGIDPVVGAVAFSIFVGVGIVFVSRKKVLALDTIIGVFFAAAMAIGVLVIGELEGVRVDLLGFLFGDILALTATDLWVIGGLSVLVVALLGVITKPLVQIAFEEDLARVGGIRVELFEYLFIVVLALVIALGIKVAGVILIAPLLIIPAAAAKNIARSFRGMLLLAVVCGLISGLLGLFGSYLFDTATGPTIVLVAACIFFLTWVARPFAR
ncbi:metal ABC transporter permease [Candidatus Uhrbacteria bacterium]|nr:metal ABC transporter permease [Candidatus Uhrbacteria bacterium]